MIKIGTSGIVGIRVGSAKIVKAYAGTDIVFRNNRKFVVCGAQGTIAYSSDGVSWNTRTAGSAGLNGIAYGNGKFVACGSNGVIAYSSDGVRWTETLLEDAVLLKGVTYGN